MDGGGRTLKERTKNDDEDVAECANHLLQRSGLGMDGGWGGQIFSGSHLTPPEHEPTKLPIVGRRHA